MPRAFTLADKMHDAPPAIVREAMPLFDFAREQAAAAKVLEAKLEAARERHERTVTVLHESMEWRELEAAKERLADAKKAAVLEDPIVQKARLEAKAAKDALKKSAKKIVEAEKAAKADVKLLVATIADTERAIVSALKAGRVPSPLIRDDATTPT